MSLKDKKSGLNVLQDFGALIALIVLVVGISIFSPEFRQPTNLLSLLRQSSINGLIAFGMTGVILTGGIDLSVGSVLALSTAFCAGMIVAGIPVPVAMLAALVIGVIFGVVSGFLVTKGRLQPFIATLITMTVYRGVTMIYTEGKPISGLGSSAFLKFIGKGTVFWDPIPCNSTCRCICDILLRSEQDYVRKKDIRYRLKRRVRQACRRKYKQD